MPSEPESSRRGGCSRGPTKARGLQPLGKPNPLSPVSEAAAARLPGPASTSEAGKGPLNIAGTPLKRSNEPKNVSADVKEALFQPMVIG
jgi:hypothetical protein